MTENNKKSKGFGTLDIVYIGLFAALICVCAWISIPLTVSVTLQTMGICITAGLLGAKRGVITTVVYILLGMIGLPVFTGFKSGISAIAGPTGGYIVGFVFTALIIGLAKDRLGHRIWTNVLFMVIGVAVCYIFGTIWFMIAYKVSFLSALMTCVVPFILFEVVKIGIASVLVNRLAKFVR